MRGRERAQAQARAPRPWLESTSCKLLGDPKAGAEVPRPAHRGGLPNGDPLLPGGAQG